MSGRTIALSRWLMPVFSGLLILVIWYGAAALIAHAQVSERGATAAEAEGVRRILLPLPGEIAGAFIAHRVEILAATRNTFVAAFAGFVLSVVAGYLIAFLLAASVYVKRALYPWVLVLQMTPVIVLAPIFAIWMGQGIVSIAAVTFVIGFFPVVANSLMGLRSTDRNLLELFAVCRAGRLQELVYLRVPSSIPYFLTGMKIAGTLAPIGAITGDVFIGSSAHDQAGIGFLTIVFKSSLEIAALYATAGIACLLGFVFVGGVHLLHWWALHNWHDSIVKRGS